MRQYLLATIWALALTLVYTAQVVSAVPVASNQFENPPKLSPQEQRRISAGHHTDSPFGSGCVGTSNLCPLALSRADETEQQTLHREAPPLLWKVLEDEQFQAEYQSATPEKRLKKFFERLGGEQYQFKRELSQAELQRLLKAVEAQGKKEREGEIANKQRSQRTWRTIFALPTSTPAPTPAPTVNPAGARPSSRLGPIKTALSTLRKRSFVEDSSLDSTDEDVDVKTPEQAENDDFHAGLRVRYARSWSSD